MRNQVFLNIQGKNPRSPLFAGMALIVLFVWLMAGCGGSKSANTTVAAVNVGASSLSMVAGEVVGLSASAVNSANASVPTTFTFHSSNTQIATISPAGNVCAGVWDSAFVVCNGSDAQGNPISGTAIITATAGGVTSGPVTVAVHPSITSVTIDPVTEPCFSIAQTHQFVAHAFHNATEITNQIGNFSWSASSPSVANVDANGLATAHTPGITGVVASVGTTTSPAVFLKSCMPVLIVLHINGDPAGVPTESAVMNVSDTKTVQADMVDELGAVTPNAPVTILSNNSTVASVSGTVLTAQSPGGAGLQAVCAPPTCGIGINTPIYSNLFSIFVSGTSPNTTTVYATSTFPNVPGSSITLIPIDASKTPPVAGSPIFLPGFPNSLLFDRAGATGYIGTSNGLASLNTSSNVVTLVSPVPIGKVLAVSADGNQVIISNAANDPSTGQPIDPFPSEQRVWVFNKSGNTITTFVVPGAVAAAFDDDGFRAYVVGKGDINGDPNSNPPIPPNAGNLAVFSPVLTLVKQTIPIGGNNVFKDVTTLASGPFVYAIDSGGLKAIATCNNAIQSTAPPTNSSNLQFVQSVRDTNTLVAVDSSGLDIESVNTADLTPPLTITPANCPGIVNYSNNFLDFGVGAFTARQLLVGSAGTHIAVLPAGLNRVLTAVNTNNVFSAATVPLPAGATEALNGSLTPDGATLWVGVAGTNTVDRINLNTNADEVQIPTAFKKADGSPAPPNLVVIKPK
jgi:hypothetical protein